MRRLTPLLIGFTALVTLFAFALAHAQVVPQNLWNPNYASSTITPRPSSLQIPCANIVGGCSSSSSVSSLNSATGTITLQGAGSTTVTTSGGTITVSSTLPQSLGTSNSPTFAGVNSTGNVTSTAAHIGSNIIGGTGASSSFAGEVDFGSNPPNIVVASSTFTELGAYMNALCNANTSGTLIFAPAMQPVSSTWTTQLQETQRCTYEGIGGGGTQWTWGGASSTPAINLDFSSLPHTVGGGIKDISIINGNSTTTNSIGILASGGSVNTSGGAHSDIEWDTFIGWHKAIDIASGSYAMAINDNSFHANDYCVYAEPSSNSGESIEGDQNWCVDPATGSTGGFYFATSSVENAYFDQLTIDNTQLQVNAASTVAVGTLETEDSGGSSGPYIPVIVANDATAHLKIGFWQLHNDGATTSTTYAAAMQVDGNLEVDSMSVGKNSSATSTPFLVTSVSGSAGSENLTLKNVVNQSNNGMGYIKLVGGAANNAFPTSTFNGTVSLYKGNYLYSMLETTNDNTVQYWNGNGLVGENTIPASGSSGNSQWCLGGGCVEANVSGTVQIVAANTSTLMIGAKNKTSCQEVTDAATTSQIDYMYASSGVWTVVTSSKPSFCL